MNTSIQPLQKIQIRLWNECGNHCTFCSLKDKTPISIESKKKRIQSIQSTKADTIGIIGGEFFEGQLKGCEKEWLQMIKDISCDHLMVTANLINGDYLLKETLDVRPDILICTSYDTMGRFKSDKQRIEWLNRVNSLDNVFCTVIPTEDLINDNFIDNIKCGIGICEPHLGIDWYKNIDKENYHAHLIKENRLFNLPNRKEFIDWIVKHQNIIDNSKNYFNNHFSTIITFDNNDNIVYEEQDRFNDSNNISECGHPYFSKCYNDSKMCMRCDIEEL